MAHRLDTSRTLPLGPLTCRRGGRSRLEQAPPAHRRYRAALAPTPPSPRDRRRHGPPGRRGRARSSVPVASTSRRITRAARGRGVGGSPAPPPVSSTLASPVVEEHLLVHHYIVCVDCRCARKRRQGGPLVPDCPCH